MAATLVHIAGNLALAWAAGSLIGLERSHNGRAAGFRTHALVALAAAAVMCLSLQPVYLAGAWPLAQGVMTGVGFLGAGVIFKEGVSVQGLTTAACIWSTSAIGLLFGQGLVGPGVMVTAAVLVTLVVFRWIEAVIPERAYAAGVVRFHAGVAPSETGLKELLAPHAVTFSEVSYVLSEGGEAFEYRAGLQTTRRDGFATLAAALRATPSVQEFELLRVSK